MHLDTPCMADRPQQASQWQPGISQPTRSHARSLHVNPLANKNRTYKLQPNSKKMVMEGMKKHTQ